MLARSATTVAERAAQDLERASDVTARLVQERAGQREVAVEAGALVVDALDPAQGVVGVEAGVGAQRV